MLVGTQGPTKPKVYDTRPAMKASPLPESPAWGVQCPSVNVNAACRPFAWMHLAHL